jgi:hypothetical protein
VVNPEKAQEIKYTSWAHDKENFSIAQIQALQNKDEA